jgi:hypothetical protein
MASLVLPTRQQKTVWQGLPLFWLDYVEISLKMNVNACSQTKKKHLPDFCVPTIITCKFPGSVLTNTCINFLIVGYLELSASGSFPFFFILSITKKARSDSRL